MRKLAIRFCFYYFQRFIQIIIYRIYFFGHEITRQFFEILNFLISPLKWLFWLSILYIKFFTWFSIKCYLLIDSNIQNESEKSFVNWIEYVKKFNIPPLFTNNSDLKICFLSNTKSFFDQNITINYKEVVINEEIFNEEIFFCFDLFYMKDILNNRLLTLILYIIFYSSMKQKTAIILIH